jgi:hypothetical protein
MPSVICRLTVRVGNDSGLPAPGQIRSVSVLAVASKAISCCSIGLLPSVRSTWNFTTSSVPLTSAGTVGL